MAKRRGTSKRFTPEQQQMFLQLLSLGMYQSVAAMKVGVTPPAISMKKKREPDFAEACDRAEAGFELSLIAKVVKSNDARIALQMLGVRFPERWARPEIRNELNVTNVNTQDLVDGITKALQIAAKRHAPFDQPDVDAGEDREPGPGTDDHQGEAGPDDQGAGVTRG